MVSLLPRAFRGTAPVRPLRTGLALALAVVALLAAACSGVPSGLRPPAFENRQHGREPGADLENKQAYRLGLGDVLKLDVNPYDEFDGEMKVDELGNVRLPYTLERLHVLGLTLEEAEGSVAGSLSPYFLRPPKVAITLARSESHFFYVLGAVPRPGKYRMADEHVFVREAVARAGWPKRNAALRRTQLVSSKPDYNAMQKVDLRKIVYEGNLAENYRLEDGDIVWVPYTYITEFVIEARHVLEFFNVFKDYGQMAVDYGEIAEDLYDVPRQFRGELGRNSESSVSVNVR